MGNANIRPALPSDAPRVLRLVEEAFTSWIPRLGRKPAPMEDDYERRARAHQLWVLEVGVGGDVIGALVLENHEASLFIENVAVLPGWQGQGYGSQLLTFAELEACQRGYAEVQLCTSDLMPEIIARYRHLGFEETDRVPGESPHRVCMSKQVAR